jgi:hypothetical protein
VQEIESALSRLSPDEMRQVREWLDQQLDQQLEDQLELTPEFKAAIESSEREMAQGSRPRVRT